MNAPMMTTYGERIVKEKPLSFHPNPLFRREDYFVLNGYWDFKIDKSPVNPTQFDQKILVPFAVETPLSGIGQKVNADDYLHYRRSFTLPDDFLTGHVILHFEAVDQIADVFLNGKKVMHHESGYFPFSYVIENPQAENVLEVLVKDDTDSAIYPRGKQSNVRGGIWYTPTSGIWRTVWVEKIPKDGFIESVRITPNFDKKSVQISAKFVGNHGGACVEAYFHDRLVARGSFDELGELTLDLAYSVYPWSPEHPNLYDLRIYAGGDKVHSYFAMRKFSHIKIGKCVYFALNNQPYFLSGVLDQGYYPDGGLTPPSDEAMINDLSLLKKCGYNFVRKHIKIEPMRWYYFCDSMGLIVSQDFVNGGSPYSSFFMFIRPFIPFRLNDLTANKLGRLSKSSRDQYFRDMVATVDRLYNVPSIAIWVPFNEGWGQFDSRSVTDYLGSLDNSRLIDSASGWYDMFCGDFNSRHIYIKKIRLRNDRKRILALTECGGYSMPVNGHTFNDDNFGYRKFYSFDTLNEALHRLYRKQILRAVSKRGLGLVVLTQLTDVESEINGLMTYDRKVVKVDVGQMRQNNLALYAAFTKRITK